MNLDGLISEVRNITNERPTVRKITFRFFHNANSRSLYVITPYWTATMRQFPMQVLKKRILKEGHACLVCQFPVKILSESIYLTEGYFKEVQKDVRDKIRELKDKHGFEEIAVAGISLGCVNALMASNGNPDVNKILLVVPGDSLSESLWRGVGTIRLKRKIKDRGFNLGELEKTWADLDPKNNINKISDKKVEIFLSKSDKVIPFTNGRRLVKDMQDAGLKPEVFINKNLGHYLTFLKFIFSYKF